MIMIHHLLLLQGTIAHILEVVYAIFIACVPPSHRGGPHNVESTPCEGRTHTT